MDDKNARYTKSARSSQHRDNFFGFDRETHSGDVTYHELKIMLQGKKTYEILQRIAAAQDRFISLMEKHVDVRQTELIVNVLQRGFSQQQKTQGQLYVDVVKIFIDSSSFHKKISHSLRGDLGTDLSYVGAVLALLQVSVEVFQKYSGSKLSQLVIEVDVLVNTKLPQLVKEKDEVKELFQKCALSSPSQHRGNPKSFQKCKVVDKSTFQQRNIVPSPGDFEPNTSKMALKRPAFGSSLCVYDYLDNQFQLLRDDLVIHLRERINKFQSGLFEDIPGVYHEVRSLHPVFHKAGLGFRLSLRVRQASGAVRGLECGSLVCLSKDNFKTFISAVVENHEPRNITQGFVDVRFIWSTRDKDFDTEEHESFMRGVIESRNEAFVMVDSSVCFETHKNVLAGLQSITERSFPFWNYIGEGETRVTCPKYLNGEGAKYDLRPVLDSEYQVNENEGEGREIDAMVAVDVLDVESWPSADRLGLDETQFLAFQSALTKEFSIIQGPPGTGKTFIILAVLKVLLHNRNVWAENDASNPILLVCSSEHALDQLLKGIVGTFEGNLVRVAPKSRYESLEEFDLRGVGHRARGNRTASPSFHREKRETRTKMDTLKMDIQNCLAKLKILETSIVPESYLKHYIRKDLYESLTKRNRTGKVFIEWLEIKQDLEKIKRSGKYEDIPGAEMRGNNFCFRGKLVSANDRKKGKKISRKTDEEIFSLKWASFNISEYGEENMPPHLNEQQTLAWNSLISDKKYYRSIILDVLNKPDRMIEQQVIKCMDVWSLSPGERWQLYRYWVNLCTTEIKNEFLEKIMTYDRLTRRCQNKEFEEDKQNLKRATLVAMTTTEATRYQTILKEIGPKIVLIEGASSVFESNALTLLSSHCQHLVMIGDPNQLRVSSPLVKRKGKKKESEISLLERLVKNSFEYTTLRYQHRMGPEISQLLKIPELYPELKDHGKVSCFPRVNGVKGNVRFIRHCQQEGSEEQTRSYCNVFEAEYVIGLLGYLLQQGYATKQITILTPYAGQIRLLEKLIRSQRSKQLDGLDISSIDGYQGKENDIILLSLVRSNKAKDIGFLKENNRMCVALSRARIGLYVFGNLAALSESSPLISRIENIFNLLGHVSDNIELCCARHGNMTIIRRPKDFNRVPEGGCQKPCSYRQDSGLSCKRVCHADDPDHQLTTHYSRSRQTQRCL